MIKDPKISAIGVDVFFFWCLFFFFLVVIHLGGSRVTARQEGAVGYWLISLSSVHGGYTRPLQETLMNHSVQ